jgi:hypothetical protein
MWDIPFRLSLMGMGVWSVSKSIAEIHATERNYGFLLVCPLSQAYLEAEYYQAIPRNLLARRKERK